ncbi:TolB family protein [Aurantibacillus circumpalustris]|uniref:TolB family protein n=1 Tax=Aurantibacillus circumpalustris TaxID=3036359 RepID=UPI00295B4223|nr:hypothetical protein [Aurantibacillus circumpalustris]
MNKLSNIICSFFLVLVAKAQLPNTDIWLFKIETDKLKQFILKDPLNITNHEGYDNQPCFSPDGKKIYYVSGKDDGQTEVFYYDIKKKKNVPVTITKTSEYSPTLIDDKTLASVVVESDSAQRIHFIDALSGRDTLKLEMDSIGYFTFLNSDTLVYYKLTQTHSLRYYSMRTKEDKWLANSPVRGFKAINRHKLIYGLKDSVHVTFYVYDFLLHKAYQYAEYPSVNEDIIWHPTWGLIKSEENKLMRFDEVNQTWSVLFDLSSFQIKKITRFIFDPENKCLVVVNNL